MVMDTPKGPLSEFDWQILGHEYDPAEPSLPTRRLDVPLPATPEGLHELAHRFAALSEEMHRAARMGETPRFAIGDALNLLTSHRNRFKALRAEWERKLREETEAGKAGEAAPEHLRAVG